MGCRELEYNYTGNPLRFPSQNSHARAPLCTEKTPYSGFSYTVIPNYRYYTPELGRWLSRDPIGEVGFKVAFKVVTKLNYETLYGFVANNQINNYDVLGLWKYKFITKTEGNYKFGDIIAIAEKDGESFKELVKYWNSTDWEQIKIGPSRDSKEKVGDKTKAGKGCEYNIFHVMPNFYKKWVGYMGIGNCHYSAIAYVDELNWIKAAKKIYKKRYNSIRDIGPPIMNWIIKNKMAIPVTFDGTGKPGDIINQYCAKGLIHSDIYLGKGIDEKLYVFQKDAGKSTYLLTPYKKRGTTIKIIKKNKDLKASR